MMKKRSREEFHDEEEKERKHTNLRFNSDTSSVQQFVLRVVLEDRFIF